MNVVWQRTFEFSTSVEKVYAGYLEMQGTPAAPPVGTRFELNDAARSQIEITESIPNERLVWTQTQGTERAEMTLSFESTETGARITVTRSGFGEGEEFEAFRQSNPLGWAESMRDLAVYLETGVAERRHLQEKSATGVVLLETEAGLKVVRVREGSLGAEVGLEPGDILVSINGAALYERSEMWMLTRLYEPGTPVEIRYARDGEVRVGDGRMSPVEMAVTGELGLGPREEATTSP